MLGTTVTLLAVGLGLVDALSVTDTITWGGDNSRAGYSSTHNMDPAIVGSDDFAQLFQINLPGAYNGQKEDMLAQPLVYTPSDGVQYLYLATTQNNVYKVNAQTGDIVATRNLHIPFNSEDLDGCVDIAPFVGVTGTGVIDPDTDTLYLTAKTYQLQDNGTERQGLYNGRYYVHALNVNDLTERDSFPIALEGTVPRNNPVRSFNGGIQLQRPALLHHGDYIYAGFGSHCVQYNFTGWVIGWHKTTGALVERFATQGEGVGIDIAGASVWMSGGGIASDDKGSIFFATGNGYASQLDQIPVNGRNPPTALEEAAVHMSIQDDGSLSLVDFFMPMDKKDLDGADKDLGTSPLELLPSQFSCGSIARMGVVTGKSGKTYFLDMDNLGGYKNGADKTDAVISSYLNDNSVYAGAGVYPLEGGYIYVNVIGFPSTVFQFSCNNGVAAFTKVANTPVTNEGILGVGHGTVTSLDGEPGTGLLWINDRNAVSLRVYKAVPENGQMTLVKSFTTNQGMTKFTRPVFGNGVVYHALEGGLIAYGAPITPALSCSNVTFTKEQIGESQPVAVTCTAKVAVTVSAAAIKDETNFGVSGLPTLPLVLAVGQTFSFEVAFHPTTVGLLTSSLGLTTDGVAGYSKTTTVRLSGTGETDGALLAISPAHVPFSDVVVGTSSSTQTILLQNLGNSALTVTGVEVSNGGPVTKVAAGATEVTVGPFVLSNLPATIAASSQVAASVAFNPTSPGNFSAVVIVNSDGGAKNVTITATSGSAPVALLEFQSPDGASWVTYEEGKPFSFGNVTENETRSLKFRITNAGPSDAIPLYLTVSKAPFGGSSIVQAANNVDLAEGARILAGQSSSATLFCSPPKAQWNTDPYLGTASWTIATNGLNFTKQFLKFECGAVAEQAAPLRPDGEGVYRYVGCFKENNPGRQLANQLYGDANNTNEMCIAACAEKGYAYCGTQYQTECWGGPTIPVEEVPAVNCGYACAGAIGQTCGGNGAGDTIGGAYISLFFNPNATVIPGAGTPTLNQTVGNWTYEGCFTEATEGRALADKTYADDTMTLESCAAFCDGYKHFGIEYARECYCGNTFGAGSVNASQADCSMTCAGAGAEFCGAGGRLSVYSSNSTSPPDSPPGPPAGPSVNETVGAYKYAGCYTEGTNGRALGDKTFANDSMTLSACADFCNGYSMFGIEYARECYCANTLGAGSVNVSQSDCSMTCGGAPSEFCGAGNRLSVYALNGTVTTPPVTTPPANETLDGWTYEGCYTESPTGRTLNAKASAADKLTLASCAASCDGFKYFGSEYGRECYCGNTLASDSTVAAASDCNMACGGNSAEICGAGSRLSVYSTTNYTATPAPGTPSVRATVPSDNGTYTFQGCWPEPANARLFDAAASASDNMTLSACAAFCDEFPYFGTEYGRECYCGQTVSNGTVPAKVADCGMPCAGNGTEFCGSGSLLSVYFKNTTVIDIPSR